MFGYFRPFHSDLTQSELSLFSSYYCRICYCLRLLGGQKARLCTTYDAAVYGMVLALQDHEPAPPYLPCERLGTKNTNLFRDDERGLKIARLTLISFQEKFRDDEMDDNSLGAKIASGILRKAVRAAQEAEPEMTRLSFEGTERINELQNGNAPLFDVLGAYGDMAAGTFSCVLPMNGKTEELVRAISEWVFFVDMVCDYDEDFREGSYNGLKAADCETFRAYFDRHYMQFLADAERVTRRMADALLAVRDDSRLWNTLFKILRRAVDTTLLDCIEGRDVKFHYFRNLSEQWQKRRTQEKERKRLGISKHE